MKPKKPTKRQPVRLLTNAANTTIEVVITPAIIHGLNLPILVWVRSIIVPIIGSLKASKTLAATMIALTAENCSTVRFLVKRMKFSTESEKNWLHISLPTVAMGKAIRFLRSCLDTETVFFIRFPPYEWSLNEKNYCYIHNNILHIRLQVL